MATTSYFMAVFPHLRQTLFVVYLSIMTSFICLNSTSRDGLRCHFLSFKHSLRKASNCVLNFKQVIFQLIAENEGPKLAGHSAVIVDDSMIVFGGVSGEYASNTVYIYDIKKSRWWSPRFLTRLCLNFCLILDI